MSTASGVGRAGFRVVHAKVGGKFPADKKTGKPSRKGGSNVAIIKEALRSLDDEVSTREAEKNANIVLSQEHLNRNYVNDGNGGLKTATSFQEPLDYLAERNAQLFRKQAANDFELSELVVHLPENLCIEDPDPANRSFVLDDDGQPVISAQTGEPLTKPRMIPRDMDEARRYFDDAQAVLVDAGVFADGVRSIHARSDQFSEHRPHMQIIFDNYAPDPKHAGKLRNEASRVWFTHRDVTYPQGHAKAGKKVGGMVKLSLYQEQLRDGMIARGWPVEREIDLDNEGISRLKRSHAKNDDQRMIAEDRLAAAKAMEERNQRNAAKLEAAREEFNRRNAAFNREKADLEREKLEAVRERREAQQTIDAANAQRQEAQARLIRLDETISTVEQVPPVFNAFLDQPLKAGRTLRPMFESFTKQYTAGMRRRAAAHHKDMEPRQSRPEQGRDDAMSR